MKLSLTTFACPQWPLPKIVEAARNHGYQGVEFRCDANHHHGVETWTTTAERREIAALLSNHGVHPLCILTSLQVLSETVLDQTQLRVQLAADIGAPAVRVLCGPSPEGLAASGLMDLAGDRLRQMADMAEMAGVELWLETHDTFSRVADCAAAIRLAQSRHIGILYDVAHPLRHDEKVIETQKHLTSLLRHVHLHDAMNDPEVLLIKRFGQGEMPLDEIIESLGYDGWLGGEWFGQEYGPDPDEALKDYVQDVTKLCERHGVRVEL